MPAPTERVRIPPPLAPELVFVNGREQRILVLDHVPFTIGRQPDRDLVIRGTVLNRGREKLVGNAAITGSGP